MPRDHSGPPEEPFAIPLANTELVNQLFEHTSDAVFAVDVLPGGDFRIAAINPVVEQRAGFRRSDVVGRSVTEAAPPEVARVVIDGYRRCLAAGQAIRVEEQIPFPNGTAFSETLLIPIRGADGQILQLIGIGRDVTEQRQIEQRLREARKLEALGALAGGVAHDLNNILAAVTSNAAFVSRYGGRPSAGEAVRDIVDACDRGRDLIRRILAFTRGQRRVDSPVDLRDVVGEAARILRAAVPEGVELDLDIADDTPTVTADPSEIHQVVMNLGTNAAQAMDGRGTLTVELSHHRELAGSDAEGVFIPAGDWARLRVIDTGRGIDPDVIDHLFEPFFTTRDEGTGLGLAVVDGIVRERGGHIALHSERGLGTRFDIYLPAALAVAGDETRPMVPRMVVARVLVLDHDAAVARGVARMLESLGCDASVETDAKAMLERLRGDPQGCDLILCELNLPDVGGVAVATRVHQLRPDLPVLVMSGWAPSLDTEALHAAGVRQVLEKPLSATELARAVVAALTRP